MEVKKASDLWKAVKKGDSWLVQTRDGKLIATVNKGDNAEAHAKLIAQSPYMLEALKAVAELIGDEDLPDSGELSGAAISDLVRDATIASSQ